MYCPEILQKNYGSSFCAACSMVAASNCVGSSVTVEQAINDSAVEPDGYVNRWGDYANIPISNTKKPLTNALLTKICDYINDHDCPVIIYTTPRHYVVAYGASSDTKKGIRIMDPLVGYTTLENFLHEKIGAVTDLFHK